MRGLYFWQMYYAQAYKSNWWGFIGKRVLIVLVAFFVISFLIFMIIHLDHEVYFYYGMGNPHDSYLVQYFKWLFDFFTGDWGYSILQSK
jgi:hypothetical protein